MEIRDSLIEIIQSMEKDIKFDCEDSLVDSGFLDSLSVLELVNALEERFGFVFDDDDLIIENFENIEKIEIIVSRYVKN